MTDTTPNAIPFLGFEPFVLGRSREQIEAAAGEPDAVSDEVFLEDAAQVSWRYDEAGVELDFLEEEGWRLSSITIDTSTIAVKGVHFIGMPAGRLQEAASAAGITDLVAEEFEEGGTCYESDACGLMIWVADDTVISLTLFPRYDETGEHPIWP